MSHVLSTLYCVGGGHGCVCVCVCVCRNILEHIHLLWQVVAEQAVEATQVGLPGEVQPHYLAQVPGVSVTHTFTPPFPSNTFVSYLTSKVTHSVRIMWKCECSLNTSWCQPDSLISMMPHLDNQWMIRDYDDVSGTNKNYNHLFITVIYKVLIAKITTK